MGDGYNTWTMVGFTLTKHEPVLYDGKGLKLSQENYVYDYISSD